MIKTLLLVILRFFHFSFHFIRSILDIKLIVLVRQIITLWSKVSYLATIESFLSTCKLMRVRHALNRINLLILPVRNGGGRLMYNICVGNANKCCYQMCANYLLRIHNAMRHVGKCFSQHTHIYIQKFSQTAIMYKTNINKHTRNKQDI